MRVERIGDATLYLGDCREVMAAWPECLRVSGVVTDPPFGIGFKYESHVDDPASYPDFIWSVVERAERHVVDGGPIFVWQASPNLRRLAEWFPRDWRLFCAAKNFVQMRPTAMQFSYDPVVVWWKPGVKPWSAGTASKDFHIANTAPVIASPENIEKQHPCPRPLDQILHVVEQWCQPDSTILDPFMGSGTTGVACAKLGRRFVGIEIEPKYFEIACKRIAAAYAEPRLPGLDQPKPTQQVMGL